MNKPYLPACHFQRDTRQSSGILSTSPQYKLPKVLRVIPEMLHFEDTKLWDSSTVQTVVVFNEGTKDLNILNITKVGDFAISYDSLSVLKAGESFEINVNFIPRNAGQDTGGIFIDTGDETVGRFFVQLVGYGIQESGPYTGGNGNGGYNPYGPYQP